MWGEFFVIYDFKETNKQHYNQLQSITGQSSTPTL